MDTLPAVIHEGADVFDNSGTHIGKVVSLKFPDPSAAEGNSPAGVRENSLIDNLAEAIWPHDMPEAEREILLAEGYLVLDTDGLMAKDRYVRSSQIAQATADRVDLKVTKDQLVKP